MKKYCILMPICVFGLILLSSSPCLAPWFVTYSPADSILYAQCDTLPSSYRLLFRFRDGGANLERAQQPVPGLIMTFDNIPGHLFSYFDQFPYDRRYRSTNYGETWEPISTLPITTIVQEGWGWCGEQPGHSMMCSWYWLYKTNNSWQSYDSTQFVRYVESTGDSVNIASLTYTDSVLYGWGYPSFNIYISPNSGQTWIAGSYFNPHSWAFNRVGAIDDMWGHGTNNVCVARDTGRTIIEPVFIAQPPERPYLWHFQMAPTNHSGEAYLLAYIDWWTAPRVTEFYLYHIQDYGAIVDSFYYQLLDFQIPEAVEPGRPVPKSFTLKAFPNPFNSLVTFTWQGLGFYTHSLTITDLLGREVWRWQGHGENVQWNGRTQSGIGAASGVYWVTLSGEEPCFASMRITLIR